MHDHLYLKKTLVRNELIIKMRKEVVPLMRRLDCGFTKITHLGRRKNDSAEMGMIELVNNKYLKEEKNEQQITLEMNDMMSFWDWENRLLDQEIEYYEDHLRELKAIIDSEVNAVLSKQQQAQIEYL